MAETNVPIGSPIARKLYSVSTFAKCTRAPSFRKNLTGAAPKQSAAEAKLKGQTSPDMPFVRITDLASTAGDTVSVDMFDTITGKPVMGDKKLAGRMMSLKFASMDIKINQYRAGVSPGGRMAQKRTVHNLRSIAQANLVGYNVKLEDQLAQVAISGQRGYQDDRDWLVPLDSDPDFKEIMVNDVLPPTPSRRLFAGDATSVANLATTDKLALADIDRIRAKINDMAFPLQPVKLPDDPQADENPLYVLYVTSRQWYYLQTATDAQSWRTFLSNAWQRAQGWKTHPLFMGSPGMWNGILIKEMRRCARFPTGSLVNEYNADASAINQVAAAVDTDRAVLMGAQALACAYGAHAKSSYYFNWHEEESDHGNTVDISLAGMGGKAKLRFADADGTVNDHGVITVDSYAPAVS